MCCCDWGFDHVCSHSRARKGSRMSELWCFNGMTRTLHAWSSCPPVRLGRHRESMDLSHRNLESYWKAVQRALGVLLGRNQIANALTGAEMKVADLQEQLRDAQCGVETELHRIYPGWTSALTTTSANEACMVTRVNFSRTWLTWQTWQTA